MIDRFCHSMCGKFLSTDYADYTKKKCSHKKAQKAQEGYPRTEDSLGTD